MDDKTQGFPFLYKKRERERLGWRNIFKESKVSYSKIIQEIYYTTF